MGLRDPCVGRDGDRHPCSIGWAGAEGLRSELKWGSRAHGQRIWMGVPGGAGQRP